MTQFVLTVNAKDGKAAIEGHMMVDWDCVKENPDDNEDLQQEMLIVRSIEKMVAAKLNGCSIKIEEKEDAKEDRN